MDYTSFYNLKSIPSNWNWKINEVKEIKKVLNEISHLEIDLEIKININIILENLNLMIKCKNPSGKYQESKADDTNKLILEIQNWWIKKWIELQEGNESYQRFVYSNSDLIYPYKDIMSTDDLFGLFIMEIINNRTKLKKLLNLMKFLNEELLWAKSILIRNTRLLEKEKELDLLINIIKKIGVQQLRLFGDEILSKTIKSLNLTSFKILDDFTNLLNKHIVESLELLKFIGANDNLNNSQIIELGVFLSKKNIKNISAINMIVFNKKMNLKEFKLKYDEIDNLVKDSSKDIRYSTVQDCTKMKIFCIHVTNAFEGGSSGNSDLKKDPFENIIKNIDKSIRYSPSCSLIKENGKSTIYQSKGKLSQHSFGVIMSYGNIYSAFSRDAKTEDIKSTNILERRKSQRKSIPVKICLDYPIQKYNKVLISHWDVGALFYEKSTPEETIKKIIAISEEKSFKEYLNGEYVYRKFKWGMSRKIIKIFPVFEINPLNNKLTLKHLPTNLKFITNHVSNTMVWSAEKKNNS